MMLFVGILIQLLLMRATLNPAPPGAPSLSLSVASVRSSYSKNQPVWIRLVLKNVGSTPVFVAQTFQIGRYVSLSATAPDGSLAPTCGRVISQEYAAGEFRILGPGQSVSRTVEITCRGKNPSPGILFSQIGMYTARISYYLSTPKQLAEKLAKGSLVVTGPIPTDPLSMKISE